MSANRAVTATFNLPSIAGFSLGYDSASCAPDGIGDLITYTVEVTGPVGSHVYDWTFGEGGGSPTSCGSWFNDTVSLQCTRKSGQPASTSITMTAFSLVSGPVNTDTQAYVPGAPGSGLLNYSTKVSCP